MVSALKEGNLTIGNARNLSVISSQLNGEWDFPCGQIVSACKNKNSIFMNVINISQIINKKNVTKL